MNELIIHGRPVIGKNLEPQEYDHHVLSEVIEVSQGRDTNQTPITYENGDVVEIIFEDGTTWITSADKIQQTFDKSNRAAQPSQYLLPQFIEVQTQDRGVFQILVKTVKFFKSKVSKALSASEKKELARKFEDKLLGEEGLYLLNPKWEPKPVTETLQNEPYILFIHGFISSYQGAFEHIFKICDDQKEELQSIEESSSEKDSILGAFIKTEYGNRILAYNHNTITKSPIENAIDLIKKLPSGTTLDIVAHSRGGLIADLLTICDKDNGEKFTVEDIEKVSATEGQQLRKLSMLADEKKIKIRKIIRAGSPMNGTYLLSENLDDFLSAVFALVELSSKGAARLSPWYLGIKQFVVSILGSRTDAVLFPGIAAMIPGSPLLNILNDPTRNLNVPLFTIEGNAEIGRNLLHSLSVILGNLIHRRANDFIVNTNSMRFGTIRSTGAYVCKTEDKHTTHFNYFCHPESVGAVYTALNWERQSDELNSKFTHIKREALILEYKNQFSINRSGEPSDIQDAPLLIEESKSVDLLDILYGENDINSRDISAQTINIKLVHGNLEFAEFPVMSGHFKDQAIVSAEKAIDRCLNYSLTDHYFLGKYPNDPEDNIVIYNDDSDFKGCILMGLGDAIEFNGFKLRKAVEHGIISFALDIRDSHKDLDMVEKKSVSSLCIGSGFGGLNMDASLTSILFGIKNANERIYEFNLQLIERNKGTTLINDQFLTPITELELIELYEHKARDAFYGLKRIKQLNYNLKIEVPDKIIHYHGGQRELNTNKTQSYWYDLITKKENDSDGVNAKMSFLSSQGGARVNESLDFYSIVLVTKLLETYSKRADFDAKLSNSLFQLLLPKRLRPMLRGQYNIVWKMNKEIAHIPWEMLHDQDSDIDPTFVNSGLVRQLITSRIMPSDKVSRELHAMIIGDPLYTKYNQLPGAQKEARQLTEKLKNRSQWQVTSLIGKGYVENSMALLNSKYKVLHICGHGVYDPITKKTGLVMEDNLLDTVFFNNLDNIPEMAFINCCYSGTMEEGFEEIYENRYNISASIGTQLIEMGVQAVVVTGWAVNDQAALAFADKFYNQMLAGESFGIATKNARRHIYDQFNNKTWAAYQCYGNPWYRLVDNKTSSRRKLDFHTTEEVIVQLHNLKKALFKKEHTSGFYERTKEILSEIEKKWPNETMLFESVANIYFELDYFNEGLELLDKVFIMSEAKYKVDTLENYIYAKLKTIIKCDSESSVSLKTEHDKKVKSAIRDITSKLDFLKHLGDTSGRQCYEGLLKMREAMVGTEKKVDDNIIAMKICFFEAFNKIQNEGIKRTVFPLMMYAFASYNEGLNQMSNIEYLGQSYEIKALLKHLKQIITDIPSSKNNFWSDIAITNICSTEMILAPISKNDVVVSLRDEILIGYKKEFKKSGTYKNLHAEMDQYEFLAFLLKHILNKKSKGKKINISKAREKSLRLKIDAVEQIYKALTLLKNPK